MLFRTSLSGGLRQIRQESRLQPRPPESLSDAGGQTSASRSIHLPGHDLRCMMPWHPAGPLRRSRGCRLPRNPGVPLCERRRLPHGAHRRSHLARHPVSCRRTGPTRRLTLWPLCQAPTPFPLLSLRWSRCSSKVWDGWPDAGSNQKSRARLSPSRSRGGEAESRGRTGGGECPCFPSKRF